MRYSGKPHPAASAWGPVGWEELTDGVLVAAQPSGAPTWFPCNDLARQKATYRIRVSAASAYRVVANGELVAERRQRQPHHLGLRAGRADVAVPDDRPRSAATSDVRCAGAPVALHGAIAPTDLRRESSSAFARQPEMMEVFVERFGPYPFAAGTPSW